MDDAPPVYFPLSIDKILLNAARNKTNRHMLPYAICINGVKVSVGEFGRRELYFREKFAARCLYAVGYTPDSGRDLIHSNGGVHA